MGDKSALMQLLPEKAKMIDKVIQRCSALKFVFDYKRPKFGIHFHKGFKVLSEIAIGNDKGNHLLPPDASDNNPKIKLEWIDIKIRLFKFPVPLKVKLEHITQKMLRWGGEPPTGKAYSVACKNEEANKRYQNYIKRNENVKKHIKKYRMRYWAWHQIDEVEESITLQPESETVSNANGRTSPKTGDPNAPEISLEPDSQDEDVDGESSSNFDEDYNADALPIKFKVLDIIPPKESYNEKIVTNHNVKGGP